MAEQPKPDRWEARRTIAAAVRRAAAELATVGPLLGPAGYTWVREETLTELAEGVATMARWCESSQGPRYGRDRAQAPRRWLGRG